MWRGTSNTSLFRTWTDGAKQGAEEYICAKEREINKRMEKPT